HALRHSYIAMLDRSGATLKEAMQLARHSDPKLTTAVYGRAQLHDLCEAVRRLPAILDGPQPGALRATGADPAAPASYTALTTTGDPGGGRLRTAEGTGPEGGEMPTGPNPLPLQEVEAVRGPVMPADQAPRVGLEPTTNRLTAGCSTIELSGIGHPFYRGG